MKQGIFSSSVRAFFVTMFGAVGITFGLIIALVFLGLLSSSKSGEEASSNYSVEVLPNAEGSRKILSKKAPAILQININGIIGLESLNMTNFREMLIESREGDLSKDRIKAILLNINTPGGTVVDADGIYRAIKAYKEQHKVPVYAYVDGLCASGGMYIASAADKIYASEVSLIGSVGVVSPVFFNVSQPLDILGVKTLTLYQGKGKDDMNPLRPWKEGEDELYKAIIKYYYDMFVEIVTKARPALSKEKLIKDYGAAVYPAPQAESYGYIDGSAMNRNDTIKLLLKELSIEDNYYQVVQLKDDNWVNKLFNAKNNLLSGTINHKIELPKELDSKLSGQFLYLYHPK